MLRPLSVGDLRARRRAVDISSKRKTLRGKPECKDLGHTSKAYR
jgi:hypothetical protein